MTIKTRKYSDLTVWEGNPRPAASASDRAEMKASLAHVGQLMPLITRPTANGAQIIAGQNRFLNIGELIAEGTWPSDKEIIVDERDLDDAAALELATSENISITMHPMHQFEAFSRLIEMGRTIVDIANGYGTTTRIVEQRLSYAKLEPRARELVKSNERDLDWASAMTMASMAEQEQMLDEIESEPRRYRTAHEIRSRLQDELVSLDTAIFDLAGIDDKLVRRDLFDPADQVYMKLSDFLPLQDAALSGKIEARKAEGWKAVEVLTARDFDIYRYNTGVTDMAAAMVVFVRHLNGAIEEHIGLALRHEERVAQISDEDADAAESIFGEESEAVAKVREEISAEDEQPDSFIEGRKTELNVKAERAALVHKAILEDKRTAMVCTLAGLIGVSAARPLTGSPFKDLGVIDPDAPARIVIEEKSAAISKVYIEHGVNPADTYDELLVALAKLSDDELDLAFRVELARNIPTDLRRIDALYKGISSFAGASNDWMLTRAYLETLSSGSLRALVKMLLPARLHSKAGKSRADMIETLVQVAHDARKGGGRLGHDERETFNAFRPEMLVVECAGDNPFAAVNDDDADDDTAQAIFA